jgi:hypothetical protein
LLYKEQIYCMKYILLACSILTGVSCNEQVKKGKAKMVLAAETKAISPDSISKTIVKDSIPQNIQIDSVIHLSFAKDSSSVTVKGHLDKKGDPVICYLPVVKGKKLTAVVTPEKAKANIRFNHILLPDGKTDGPFSPSIKYDLVQKGTYKLYIGHNRMAGDPVSSDFVLTVKVH